MARIMGSKAQTFISELEYGGVKGKRGSIIVRGEAVESSNFMCSFKVKGFNLPNLTKECCGLMSELKPVHYEISKSSQVDLNHFRSIYKSPVNYITDSPEWPAHKINLGVLSNNDETLPLRISIMWGTKCLGSRNTTVTELRENKSLTFNSKGSQLAIDFKCV